MIASAEEIAVPLNRWIIAAELISDLSLKGVQLESSEGRLRFRAPDGVLNDRVRKVLVEYKPEIVDLLQPRPDLDIKGVTMTAFVFNSFRVNTYVCHSEGEAVIVDPGCLTASENQALLEYMERNGLRLRHVLATHGHVDHFCGGTLLAEYFGQQLRIHPADLDILNDTRQGALMSYPSPVPQVGPALEDGEVIHFGSASWRVIHCPGHSDGSVCFHDARHRFVFTGDTLFRGATGGKLAGAEAMRAMLDSIRDRLLSLEAETVVLPGHGPRTTVAAEQSSEIGKEAL